MNLQTVSDYCDLRSRTGNTADLPLVYHSNMMIKIIVKYQTRLYILNQPKLSSKGDFNLSFQSLRNTIFGLAVPLLEKLVTLSNVACICRIPEKQDTCSGNVSDLVDCYLANPDQVLRCNQVAQSFDSCVNKALVSFLGKSATTCQGVLHGF